MRLLQGFLGRNFRYRIKSAGIKIKFVNIVSIPWIIAVKFNIKSPPFLSCTQKVPKVQPFTSNNGMLPDAAVKQNKDMAYRSMLLLQSRVHIRTETVPVLWRTGIPLVPVCGRRAYGHLPWAGYKDCRFHLDDIRSVGHYNNLGFYRKRSEHKYRNANFHHKYLKNAGCAWHRHYNEIVPYSSPL